MSYTVNLSEVFTYTAGSEAGSNWTDDNNIWDSNINTYAYRLPSSETEPSMWIKGSTNNVPAYDNTLNPITKVVVSVTYLLESWIWPRLFFVPVWNGTTDGSVTRIDTSMEEGMIKNINIDITAASGHPAWTWAALQALDIKFYLGSSGSYYSGYGVRIYNVDLVVYYNSTSENPPGPDPPPGGWLYGLECRDSANNITLTIANRYSRFIGSATISAVGTYVFNNVLPTTATSQDVRVLLYSINSIYPSFQIAATAIVGGVVTANPVVSGGNVTVYITGSGITKFPSTTTYLILLGY
jgi:hypothetical protein